MRPCSCIEAYAHHLAGLELARGEHILRNPECDVWGENVVRYKVNSMCEWLFTIYKKLPENPVAK